MSQFNLTNNNESSLYSSPKSLRKLIDINPAIKRSLRIELIIKEQQRKEIIEKYNISFKI